MTIKVLFITKDGKNNGIVEGIKYFDCQELCGIFVNFALLEAVNLNNKKEQHKKMADEILTLFESSKKITFNVFKNGIFNDTMICEILEQDILPLSLQNVSEFKVFDLDRVLILEND